MKFKPGERARITRAENCPRAVGAECTVLGPAPDEYVSRLPVGHEPIYVVDLPGFVHEHGNSRWVCLESSLEKLIPPGWEKTTWDECPWRPARNLLEVDL